MFFITKTITNTANRGQIKSWCGGLLLRYGDYALYTHSYSTCGINKCRESEATLFT